VTPEITHERLAAVTMRTLEDAAFIFSERTDSPPAFRGPLLEARLTYEGPDHGELTLTSTTGFADLLAANLLGVEADDPEVAGKGPDALGELLNILGGVWAAELFGARATCRLGLPEVRERPAPARDAPAAPGGGASVTLLVDGREPRLDVRARRLRAEG
jgi:hypothetical protein